MKRTISMILMFILAFSLTALNVFAAEREIVLDQADGRLEITESGTYVLTGSMDGTVYVDPGEGDVTLILDGADINGGEGPAIIAVSGDSLRIELQKNSVSRVRGGTDDEYEAAVYSSVDTVFDGEGSLYMTNEGDNGIRTENADLTFDGGNYAIKAVENGITADGKHPGTITINGGHFSIQANNSIDPDSSLVMNGGEIVEENAASQPTGKAQNSQAANPEEQKQGYMTGETQITEPAENAETGQINGAPMQPEQMNGQPGRMGQNGEGPMQPGQMEITGTTDSAAEVAEGTMTNSAASLEADYENATYISVTDEESQIVIKSSGTYVISGTSSDGNITVKKGTTGVVLVLEDLDLTSTTGATVSVNKEAEVKIIISGNVVLTDNENPDDEYSEDEDVADAYDGAALKVKAGADVYLTGDGTLTIYGNAKNGIKAGDDSTLIFDEITVNITAVNDGINGNYDVTLLGGNFTIAAGDDAIHADHILTIGSEDGTGPKIRVTESTEGLEGTVVNIYGGDISIVSSDDAINAANGDGIYEGELDYSFNMMGGELAVKCNGDGIDSNGNVNLIGGTATILSGSVGGEAGIDYDGQLYVSEDFRLNNSSGTSGPDGMGGMPGMPGQEGAQPGRPAPGEMPGPGAK